MATQTLFNTPASPRPFGRKVFRMSSLVRRLGRLVGMTMLLTQSLHSYAQEAQPSATGAYVVPMQSSFVPEERVLSHREQAPLVRGWLETR
ncbi:MAG: hypothetical protein NWP69_10080, partial [Congregibacter sp.]|nr:hypothetical protein [Congregibacter sp.]